MTFTLPERAMMRKLFDHGTVSEMHGTYKDGTHERRWEIIFRPKNIFRDDAYFDVGLSGCYEWETADTLDEALDALETMTKEVAA